MPHPPIALDDQARLATIATFDLFRPELRRRLDEICRDTAGTLGWPVGAVTIVLDYAQYLAGLHDERRPDEPDRAVHVDWSFCASTVRGADAYTVADAARSADDQHRSIFADTGIRSYAGVPLVAADGAVIGAHCVSDVQPRDIGGAELRALREAADRVLAVLEEFRVGGRSGR
ncbi:GAF domain-containing protein [Actinoplanes teichomyceticus]|uniref:GAF domain-containing protein n=1 Tax=Actinoplanes teichomyceticus TaxID=1867 RepID=A0A561WMH1_ACTTI|nr:GAF domain-containing protein [Actinoplanes teichomyceticus]TWG25049.1 GAF domain-containing protein [Actinoplanes teichomyceticus]GIF10119.1 hypothetical protein Ate01nite_01510 [Actinoplanes teichomyceticus]